MVVLLSDLDAVRRVRGPIGLPVGISQPCFRERLALSTDFLCDIIVSLACVGRVVTHREAMATAGCVSRYTCNTLWLDVHRRLSFSVLVCLERCASALS